MLLVAVFISAFLMTVSFLLSLHLKLSNDYFQNTEATMECSKHIFIETIREMTDFTDTQLESLQNLSPETKKKLKTTIMGEQFSIRKMNEAS